MDKITLRIDARRYEDHDDCLSAAANDVAKERGLEGWNLSPRWEDNQRNTILIDVPAVRLTGHDAIEYAELHGVTLSKYTDPTEAARDGLTAEEARGVAREDPSLIYVDADLHAQHRADAYDAAQDCSCVYEHVGHHQGEGECPYGPNATVPHPDGVQRR